MPGLLRNTRSMFLAFASLLPWNAPDFQSATTAAAENAPIKTTADLGPPETSIAAVRQPSNTTADPVRSPSDPPQENSSDGAPWSNWQAAALARFKPIADDQLSQNQVKLAAHLTALRATLAEMPDGGVLARHMKLDDLDAQLRLPRADPERLDEVARSMSRSFPRAVRQPVDALRGDIQRQAGWLRLREIDSAATTYKQHVERVAAALAKPIDGNDPTACQTLRESFAWLARTYLLDDLLDEAANKLSHPNQIIRVDRAYLSQLSDQPISQPVTVNESQQGVRITGSGTMQAQPAVEMRPNAERAEINVHVTGKGTVPIVARKKPATIQATSRTQFTADQTMFVTPQGIEYRQPEIQVRSKTSLSNVDLDLRCRLLKKLVLPLARKVAAKQLSKGDASAAAKARKEIESTLVEQAYEAIDHVNELIDRLLWQTIDARDVIRKVRVSTTPDALAWNAEYRALWQLGALAPPPAFSGQAPQIELRFHESSFNNTAAVAAGRRMDEVIFEELVFGNLRLTPEEVEPNRGGRQASTFTFADIDPLEIHFDRGRLQAMFHVQSFSFEGREYAGPIRTVRVEYQPHIDHRGVRLERLGEIVVEPADAPNQAEFRHCLERFLVARARADRKVSESQGPSHLSLNQVLLDHGWFQVGMSHPAAR